ncbi:unnamed protein product [Fusarium graminearum]|uniref:Uncharacterized protein n=1 Tax=Gibberella zeae TaxID=5518 RepID=A0A9N8WZ18_GIBZA|nr:unnamed protein product [Fusarium graminearum]
MFSLLSLSNATADALGYNGHSSGAKLPIEVKCIVKLNGTPTRTSNFCLISHDEDAARSACSDKNLPTLPRRGKHSAQYGGGHSAFTSSAAVPSGARRSALLVSVRKGSTISVFTPLFYPTWVSVEFLQSGPAPRTKKHTTFIDKVILCIYLPCPMNQATRRLTPPFSKENALVHDVRRVAPFLDAGIDTHAYLETDLHTPRLDKIYSFLWLAGLPRPARPLHRQNLLLRTIYLTEAPDEHLEQELCNDAALYGSAYGLLVSYAWLVRHKSDLRIAIGAGLLPVDIHWNDWVVFVADLNIRLDSIALYEVNHRYRYGELRLSRLNSLYHLGLAGLSFHNTVYGFMSGSVRYTTFFERNFGWMLAVFVYVTVILSAMQVALATNKFGSNGPFQQFSYGHETCELVRTMLENNDIPNDEISGLATRLENLSLALAQAASFQTL